MRGFVLLYLPLALPGVDPPYWDEPVPLSEVGPPTVPFGSPVFVLFVAPEPMPVVPGFAFSWWDVVVEAPGGSTEIPLPVLCASA
jgi:hypothetical protein